MKTVCVTGVAGFIGSHVAELLLNKGYDVVGLDDMSGGTEANIPEGVTWWTLDITDHRKVNDWFFHVRPNSVIHCASFAAENLSHFVRRHCITNVAVGTTNLINASVNCESVKYFSLFSSVAVMGAQEPPFTEDMPPSPIDVYGAAKYLTECDIKAASEMWGISYNIWRAHNVVGIRQQLADGYRNCAAIFFRAILEGRPLPVFSDGLQTRSFSPVADVVGPVVAALERPVSHNHIFNIGADRPVRVLELAQMVSDAMGVPLRVEHLPARHEAVHAFSNHEKARRYFSDVMDKVPLQKQLKEMADWVRAQTLGSPKKFRGIEIERGLPPSWF